MTCLISNLHVQNDAFFVHIDPRRNDLLELAGFYGHFGIGDPSTTFYIDGWSDEGVRRKAFRKRKARERSKKYLAERHEYGHRRFIPITMTFDRLLPSRPTIPTLTMIVQGLWMNNFFRRMYFGAATMATCRYWYNGDCTDLSIYYVDTAVPLEYFSSLKPGFDAVISIAIVGISKRTALPEQDILMLDDPNYPLLRRGYQEFAQFILRYRSRDCPSLDRLFAYRMGSDRRVVNWEPLTTSFNLTSIVFEALSLSTQLCIVSKTNLLVAAHGAALTHILFLPPSATVIELFPCVFRKSIYRNLATIMGIKYAYWQAGSPRDCPDLPQIPLDWTSQSSKDAYRRQSYHVDLYELQQVIKGPDPNTKFLLYMPWEQYNNQLISLRCACAMAVELNRTLVLPEIGYYTRMKNESRRRVYDPRQFTWMPLSRYYNTTLLMERLPCHTIPGNAVYGRLRVIDHPYFRRLGARYNRQSQVEHYYYYVAGLSYRALRSLPYDMPVYLDSVGVRRYLGKYERKVKWLPLGNVFWMHTFDAPLEYPVIRYVDVYPLSTLYQSIANALVPHAHLTVRTEGRRYGVMHWRRGDYRDKCADEATLAPNNARRCYPSSSDLIRFIMGVDPRRVLSWAIISNRNTVRLLGLLRAAGYTTMEPTHSRELDPIENGIADQLLAIEADIFVGNMYSSFTRTIVDMRHRRGRTSLFL